jgi:predicted RNA polymerase sigma factor
VEQARDRRGRARPAIGAGHADGGTAPGPLPDRAIAALHDDAASAEETDWPQILAWYDDLVALTDDPVHQDPAAVLGRAVAVGHMLGAAAGLRETDRLRELLGDRHRWHAVRGHLHELDGDLPAAGAAYAEAARRATHVAERDHLVRQAARARAGELCRNSRLTERPP